MIEVNVKAKPFNAAESVIGSDLMLCLSEAQLVGWHYFCDKPPVDKGKSVIGIAAPGKYNITLKKIKMYGWVAGKVVNGLTTKYHKVNEKGLLDTFFMIDNWDTYEKWCDAAEICKLLGISYGEENKKMVKFIHQIVVDGHKVVLDADGHILKVAAPAPKLHLHHEEDHGFGHVAQQGAVNPAFPPLHVPQPWAQQAQVMAAEQMMAEVQAQIENDQLQQAGMADNNGG